MDKDNDGTEVRSSELMSDSQAAEHNGFVAAQYWTEFVQSRLLHENEIPSVELVNQLFTLYCCLSEPASHSRTLAIQVELRRDLFALLCLCCVRVEAAGPEDSLFKGSAMSRNSVEFRQLIERLTHEASQSQA